MPGKKNRKTPVRFNSMMDPEIHEALKALAWYERVSQRHIIEEAFKITYSLKSHRVKKAILEYRKQKSDR